MKYNDIINIYSYICSFGNEGVRVGEIIKKFNIKKRDIISFLKVMSNFSENIEFHYYSPEEDVEYEDFDDIDENTIIDINDKIFYLNSRLSLNDSTKIQEIIEDYDIKDLDGVINKINDGQAQDFTYITKGNGLSEKQKKLKDEIIKVIGMESIIDLEYYNGASYERLRYVSIIGMYYERILKKYIVVISDKNGKISELYLQEIKEIYKLYKDKNELYKDFNIKDYLKNIRNKKLTLVVFDEANVIKKLENAFKNFGYKIEEKEDYYIFTVNVEDPFKYKEFINGFGRSVVVKYPENLRKNIYEENEKVLEMYEERK